MPVLDTDEMQPVPGCQVIPGSGSCRARTPANAGYGTTTRGPRGAIGAGGCWYVAV